MLITSVALLTRTNYGTLATAGTPSAFLLLPSDLALFLNFYSPLRPSVVGTNPGFDQKYHDLLINFRGVFCFHQIVFWRRIIDRNSKHLCSDLDHF